MFFGSFAIANTPQHRQRVRVLEGSEQHTIPSMSPPAEPAVTIVVHTPTSLDARIPSLLDFLRSGDGSLPLSRHPAWLRVLRAALGHEVYAIEALQGGITQGYLPLASLSSFLFGRFLISLPYLNTSGVSASQPEVQTRLIDRAVQLADELDVRYLELRHEAAKDHPALTFSNRSKVHMRLPLPPKYDLLWSRFDPKVRNQIRKGQRQQFQIAWGGSELLTPFYTVLCANMRDLGSPVYGQALFHEALQAFPERAELCVVFDGCQPVASALLLHGWGITEVPTASALRSYNSSCVNMWMYSELLARAISRGQSEFDFGRSTVDSNTYRFKKQWRAQPQPAAWQYYLRSGQVSDMRPENPRYQLFIQLWRRMPVALTRVLGPAIVRGIP